MDVEYSNATKSVQSVAATMAVAGMPLSQAFVQELIKVANGDKTSEQLRTEVLNKYTDKNETPRGF